MVELFSFFFFQAEDGIRDVERSRGLGDVYKRQAMTTGVSNPLKGSETASPALGVVLHLVLSLLFVLQDLLQGSC